MFRQVGGETSLLLSCLGGTELAFVDFSIESALGQEFGMGALFHNLALVHDHN